MEKSKVFSLGHLTIEVIAQPLQPNFYQQGDLESSNPDEQWQDGLCADSSYPWPEKINHTCS